MVSAACGRHDLIVLILNQSLDANQDLVALIAAVAFLELGASVGHNRDAIW